MRIDEILQFDTLKWNIWNGIEILSGTRYILVGNLCQSQGAVRPVEWNYKDFFLMIDETLQLETLKWNKNLSRKKIVYTRGIKAH